MVAQSRDRIHLVFDQQDRDALGDKATQMLANLIGERWVHAGDRLVEQQHARLGPQRAGDLQELLLPTRQRRRGGVEDALQVEPLGNRAGPRIKSRFSLEHGLRSYQRDTKRLARLMRPVKQEVLEHRQTRNAARDLERPDDPDPADAVGPPARDVVAIENDPAGICRHQAGDAVEQRGLACAVRPDQASDAARLDCEVDAEKSVHAVKIARDLMASEKAHNPDPPNNPDDDTAAARRLSAPALATGGRVGHTWPAFEVT